MVQFYYSDKVNDCTCFLEHAYNLVSMSVALVPFENISLIIMEMSPLPLMSCSTTWLGAVAFVYGGIFIVPRLLGHGASVSKDRPLSRHLRHARGIQDLF